MSFYVLDKGLAAMGLFFIHVYSYLHLVLNFASFSDLGLATMGLDLVSFTVLDLGLAAVGLDLVSFLSLYSKTICPALKLYLLVPSKGLAKWAWAELNNTLHSVYMSPVVCT